VTVARFVNGYNHDDEINLTNLQSLLLYSLITESPCPNSIGSTRKSKD
jgi:hypothetical protein